MPNHIGLIVSGEEALYDFQIFVKTLELFHSDIILWVGTDSATDFTKIKHTLTIHTKVLLDAYIGKRRQEMEALPGKIYDSLFKDYTYEKATVMEWIFSAVESQGVWFMDADIIHCAPLPTIPDGTTLALSPHYIRPVDEARFGKYNAGYMWLNDPTLLKKWREAGFSNTFYEQKPLEEVAKHAIIYEFPAHVNFGWWRMFQSPQSPPEIQSRFSIFRNEQSIGIRYNGIALQSIHTHSSDKSYGTNGMFNQWLLKYVERVKGHPKARQWKSIVFS